MPHYFLDLEHGPECIMDVSGCHATDDQEVLNALHEVLDEIAIAPVRLDLSKKTWVMSISDQSGRLVAKVPI